MSKRDDLSSEQSSCDTNSEFEEASSTKVSSWVKKAISNGVGAIFSTEEGIRSAFGEMKLSKDMISSVVSGVDKTKKEVVQVVAREFRRFLDGLKIQDLIKKVLTGTTFEIEAKIKMIPSSDGELKVAINKADKKRSHKTAKKISKRTVK